MVYSASFLAVALPLLAATVSAADFPVKVGVDESNAAKLVYTPNVITAAEGDTVTFTFYPKNHTVTQSSFAAPCTPLNSPAGPGFDSGFIPVAATATTTMAWTLQVTNASAPIWIYCAQGNHCAQGMVMAINPPASGNTFDRFLATAQSGAAAAPPGVSASGGAGAAGVGASAPGGASAVPTGTAPPAGSGATTIRVGSALVGAFALVASTFLLA